MSDSISAYYEDLADYKLLCNLLQVPNQEDMYKHLEELKKDPRIVYTNYTYKLKEK